MKNEDKIVELLAELVHKQDVFTDKMTELVDKQDVFADGLKGVQEGLVNVQDGLRKVVDELKEQQRVQHRQENLLVQILEVLQDDVPRFDEVLEVEQLEGGKRIILRKYRSSPPAL